MSSDAKIPANDELRADRAGFFRRWIFSTDHKVVGVQYLIAGLLFLLFGFSLIALLRWQLAYPGKPIPMLGALLEHWLPLSFPNGILSSEFYNSLGAMHGTIMVFLGVVPIVFGAFGNYLVPLQIGARTTAFPKLCAAGFWTFLLGGLVILASFFAVGGPAQCGWTNYSPLANTVEVPGTILVAPNGDTLEISRWFNGQTLWLIGIFFIMLSSVFGAINLLTTIIQLRAPGMRWMRLPFFVWSQLVAALLLLLAFPPLGSAAILQFMDRVAGTSFFLPTGLVANGVPMAVSGGGSPLLWQHLFWFLAHPEVYVLVLPAIGIVTEIIANNTRKTIFGYRAMVGAVLVLGFFSMLVWAHHMYLTGMGVTMSGFFELTTILVSVPSVIMLSSLVISCWGGSIRFTVPMLFALAFIPEFAIGGFSGIPLALNANDVALHDTMYVIAHFHFLVAPGTIFAIFAGIYFWFPKVTERMMNEKLGRWHFALSLFFINFIFFPMFIQGFAGVHRRWWDGGASIAELHGTLIWNKVESHSAWALGVVQILFIFNFFWSIWRGKKVTKNPWDATTLEWSAASPPPRWNFDQEIEVIRDPYEYSAPGAASDFLPQHETANRHLETAVANHEPAFANEARPDTGFRNSQVGIALFIASQLMLFSALFSSYLFLKQGADYPWPHAILNLRFGIGGVISLLAACVALRFAKRNLEKQKFANWRWWLAVVLLATLLFIGFLTLTSRENFARHFLPKTNTFFAIYYAISGFFLLQICIWWLALAFDFVRLRSLLETQIATLKNRLRSLARYLYFLTLIWIVIFFFFYR